MRREVNLRGWLREMAVSIREKLGLVEGLTKSGILDAQLIDESTALLPTPVCLVGRCEGGVQQLGTRFEGLYMTVRFEDLEIVLQGEIGNSRVSSLAKGSLSFTVLFGTFALCEGPSGLWGVSTLLRG